jgi:hypothetical protein
VIFLGGNRIVTLEGLEYKTFNYINLLDNPIYHLVSDWINSDDKYYLVEYFVDLNIIQDIDLKKPRLVIDRLNAFYEDTNLETTLNNIIDLIEMYYDIVY